MGQILKIPFPDIQGQPVTTLTAAAALGATSLSVTNSGGLTASKYILIGGHKSPVSEIKLGGAISSAISIATAATSFNHVAGETVQQIPYNQVEITYSTDFEGLWHSNLYADIATAAAAASWSTLSSGTALVPSQEFTTVKDDSTASRTYRWRYKNSNDTVYSDYFNYQFPSGFEEKSLAAIARKATSITNKKVSPTDIGQITNEFIIDETNQCLRDITGSRKRWSHDASFNGTLGDIVAGQQAYVLPNNIESRDNKISIWNVRINDQFNIRYIDKREWDVLNVGVHHSTLTVALSSVSATATFTDTSNFDDSGTFNVWVNGVEMTITYTANNRTTNVLTCPSCATEVTATAAIGTNVWQGASFGTPIAYTVFNGYIYFDTIPDDSIHARTIGADYYLRSQQVTALTDYIRESDPNLVINWLRWAISIKSNNEQMGAMYRQMYDQGLKDLQKLEFSGQKKYMTPQSWRYGQGNRNMHNSYYSRFTDRD